MAQESFENYANNYIIGMSQKFNQTGEEKKIKDIISFFEETWDYAQDKDDNLNFYYPLVPLTK